MISEGARSPESRAIGWTPGSTSALEPDGMAWRLDAGTDLLVNVHMLAPAAGATEFLQPSVGFYFTSQPPARLPVDFKLGSKTIDIPAGASTYAIEDAYELPVDVEVLSVYPHAHYLAKEMRASATLPDGSVVPLIWIRNWNFHWQDEYRYTTPIRLPRGSRVQMRFTYDNSASNQADRPPAAVSRDVRTTVVGRDGRLVASPRAAFRRRGGAAGAIGYRATSWQGDRSR